MTKEREARCVVACLIVIFLAVPAAAAPKWIQLKSANFLLEGDAEERDLRDVARHFEEFRETLVRMLPSARFDRTPSIVLVFANEHGYGPVRPVYQGKPIEAPAFFQTGQDANYVAMVLGREDPLPMVYHEFTHLFVHANLPVTPLWFNEGLAEFYGSFAVTGDGRHAYVGNPIEPYVMLLRDRWVPLEQVLSTFHNSPLYNNSNNRPVFYAESWAFVHYLLNGATARRGQIFKFLGRLATGARLEEASTDAFGTSIAGMEKEVLHYVQQASFKRNVVPFDEPIASRISARAQPLAEAAAEARIGDLLMHMNRNDEAEKRLQNALRLDPGQVLAHLSLGEMRLRQQKEADGLKYLERATTLDPNSYDAHVAYGVAVIRRASFPPTPASLEIGRKAYARALEIRPDSSEAMGGLAWALFLAGQRLDEAQRLAERAMAADPGEPDYVVLLAQLHANQGDFAGARSLLGPLMASSKPDVRERARTVMTRIMQYEKATEAPPGTNRVVGIRNPGAGGRAVTESPVIDTPPSGTTSHTLHLRRVKDGEQRAVGSLERIECTPAGIVFHVKSADRTLRVSAAKFDGVEFITYRDDLKGNVQCGARTPADPVYVTFRPAALGTTATAKSDGEVVAIEFVPKDYVEKKQSGDS